MTKNELWVFWQELEARQKGYFVPVGEVEV